MDKRKHPLSPTDELAATALATLDVFGVMVAFGIGLPLLVFVIATLVTGFDDSAAGHAYHYFFG